MALKPISSLAISQCPQGEEPIHALPAEQILAALEQVLGSHAFRAADSQRAFLRFVAEEALAGRGKEIKEYSIAIEAFGRGADFDPRLDPIVRTQARKLRARLCAYYETEGARDAIRIELRKGSYVPLFHSAEPLTSPAHLSVEAAEAAIPAQSRTAITHRRGTILAGAALLILCFVAFFYLLHERAGGAHGSLAIMPLSGVSGETGEEVFRESLSRALIDALSQAPGLQVVAGTSGAGQKNSSVQEIGRKFHTHSVLTGTLLKAGSRIRVRVRLSDGADGSSLWSGTYEGDASDAQMVEREITQEVIDVLQILR